MPHYYKNQHPVISRRLYYEEYNNIHVVSHEQEYPA